MTDQKSATVQQMDASPQDLVTPRQSHGRVRYAKVDFTQDGSGATGSTAVLALLPAGRNRILGDLCKVYYDAFGSSRTLDIGHNGYTKRDGTVVAAVTDFFVDGEDVSSAGNTVFDNVEHGTDPATGLEADHGFEFDARAPVDILATVAGGTIPDGTKLWGYIAYVKD